MYLILVMDNNWSIELADWTKSNLKSLEFIYANAKESFDATANVDTEISSRAFTFISILIPIISLIIGLLGNKII